jgi:hypothetical protein
MMVNLLINWGEFETHQRPHTILSLTPSVKETLMNLFRNFNKCQSYIIGTENREKVWDKNRDT